MRYLKIKCLLVALLSSAAITSPALMTRRAVAQAVGTSKTAETSGQVTHKEADNSNFQIHAGWQPLFNGRDLSGWYTFLQKHGRNSDPDRLIAIEDGTIHLYRDAPNGSEVVQGYIATEKPYGNYHLRIQYRWGEKKFQPRAAMPRDAGLYYHLIGDDAVWPMGLQYQIQEDNTGDLLALFGLQADSWIDPATKNIEPHTFQDAKLGGVPVVFGGSGIAYQTRGIMNEMLGWNTLELIVQGASVTHILNGKTVNRCENVRIVDAKDPTKSSPVTEGRIALEIEAAEIWYRNIEIKQLDSEPSSDEAPAKQSNIAMDLRVGASAVDLRSDGTMVIAGGIEPHYAAEQEGKLRAVAVVVERPEQAKLAIVACDVLWVPRDLADAAVAEIERKTGIPASHILINATHTHHAPSTAPAHGFGVVPEFRSELQNGIIRAVEEANGRLEGGDAALFFHLAREDTVGSNSRQLLEDGGITWGGQQLPNAKARSTAPFDPQLPVLDFRDASGKTRALLFNHSTHTIGTRSGRDVRSPSFYGLTAQELEAEFGGIVSFLEGASGSTHNVAPTVPVLECINRLKETIRDARTKAQARPVTQLAAMRRPFKFRVRQFNEGEEDAKIARYMMKYAPESSDRVREVFANMRRQLSERQGAEQETWIQAVILGDVAIVGVPAEYFTVLGTEIKRRSPFEFTYVAELANDWIGYLPDREGHRLGGYQTWMGLHCYAEEGTGERMVDEVIQLLRDLAASSQPENGAKHEPAGGATATPDEEVQAAAGPQSPDAEQSTFELADPSLKIELVASEPQISSPVAVAWDADGRMYVAQMSGYPTTEGLGKINRLEDSDGDGQYDRTVTFCDELNFPTSVMPYRDGLLVADAPDILYLQDTNEDGRADLRRVEWTGFGTGSQQLRANSLHWGLDNWIYVANGRCDGDVRRPDAMAEEAISIRARDFRFHPISGAGEAILGQSQFGQAHDVWGNRFLSWNTIPIRHVLLEEADVRHYPAAAVEAVANIADPSDSGRVYPISEKPRQFNSEPAHFYNAMCGLTIYTGDALGPEFTGNAFVCESLTNLITRRRLQPAGPSFVSRRIGSETDREFLASKDPWFHPVNLATGPDGALYIVDFYRELVEHPLYVADEKLRREVPWRKGAEYGRIWRVTRADRDKQDGRRAPQLSRASTKELVSILAHPNAWCRNTAQRLLVERQDQSAVAMLREQMRDSPSSLARLHSMYTLDGLDAAGMAEHSGDDSTQEIGPALDDSHLMQALRDPEPNVRRHAVRLAASRLQLSDELLKMADDPDAAVRFQLAVAIGRSTEKRSLRAVVTLLDHDDSTLFRLAVLCGISNNAWPFMRELLEDEDRARQLAVFLEQVSDHFGTRANDDRLAKCLSWITANPDRPLSAGGLATLAGLSRGMSTQGKSLRATALQPEQLSRQAAQRLNKIVMSAEAIAVDVNRPVEDRARAAMIAANGETDTVARLVEALVQPGQPPELHSAAIGAAVQANSSAAWKALFDRWPSHSTSTRQVMLSNVPRSVAGIEALIVSLEADILSAEELPPSTRDVLAQLSVESLRQRVTPFLASVVPADRAEVLSRYADVTSRRGNSELGADIFKQNCQSCHALQGIGPKVGPDLASVASRRTDLLIVDILDPSQQVTPDYVNYLAMTKDGRVLSGMIAGETAESVTLRREQGQQDTIPRSDIEELRATGKSLMPDGLEAKITPDQLADLIEFLRDPNVKQLN